MNTKIHQLIRKHITSALIVLTALLLAGCDTFAVNPSIKEEQRDQIENIAVANLLDNTFQGIHIGTTIFNNKYYEADVADWEINKTMCETTKAYIENETPYTCTILELSNAERLALLKNGNQQRPLLEDVLALAKSKGADTIMFYRGVYYENEPFHRSPYGYYSRKIFNISNRSVYSLFILDVYDVKTGKNIAWHWGFPYGTEPAGVDWKEDFSEFTDAEKETLKQALESQVNGSILTALAKIFKNTTSAVPPVGN